MDETARQAAAREVFTAFLRQGLTAFGGPAAHLAAFRREFVERRGWLSDQAFAEYVALAHMLPGETSTQVGLAIGQRRAGLTGALAAWAGFALPAGLVMILLGLYTPSLTALWGYGWLQGLKIAAVAVVLQALLAMVRTLAVGPIRAGMAIGAAGGLLLASGPVATICALIAGGLFGAAVLRDESPAVAEAPPAQRPRSAALAVFAVLLAALPLVIFVWPEPALALLSAIYRVGSLTFGGAHAMLPMLEGEVVSRGWLDRDTLLAGYGAAQGLPGPVSSIAGFVGAAQTLAPGGGWLGLMALGAMFLPGMLLMAAALPAWDRIKASAAARGASAGLGAVVTGVLAATVWDPLLMEVVHAPADLALLAAAFVFLAVARLPPVVVVVGFAAATGLILR